MTTQSPSRRLGLVYAGLAPVCWGSMVPISKAALGSLPPVLFLTIALIVSSSLFWVAALRRQPSGQEWRTALCTSWLGLLEPGLAYLFGVFGLAETASTTASLIGASESILVIALAALLFGERVSRRFLGLALLAFVGLAVVIGVPHGGEALSWRGDGLYAAGVAAAALYVVLSARVVPGQTLALTLAGQQTAALILTLAALAVTGVPAIVTPSPAAWGLTLLDGVLQALAFFCFFRATDRLGTSLPSLFLTLIPVTGLTGAVLTLGESLSLAQGLGAALTLVALTALSFC